MGVTERTNLSTKVTHMCPGGLKGNKWRILDFTGHEVWRGLERQNRRGSDPLFQCWNGGSGLPFFFKRN